MSDIPSYRESRPVPDPTLLSVELVTREIAHLKELMRGEIDTVHLDLDNHKIFDQESHVNVKEDLIKTFSSLEERIKLLEKRDPITRNEYQTRHESLEKDIAALQLDQIGREGSRLGGKEMFGYVMGFIGIIGLLLSLAVRFG